MGSDDDSADDDRRRSGYGPGAYFILSGDGVSCWYNLCGYDVILDLENFVGAWKHYRDVIRVFIMGEGWELYPSFH